MRQAKRDTLKGKRVVDFLKKVHLSFTFFPLTFSLTAYASGAGTSTANSLKVGVGARAVAMGEAYTAVADDVYSTYWNPAGLGFLTLKEAAFMHAELVEGLKYEYTAMAVPSRLGTFGGSLGYFSYGDVQGYDNMGTPLGTLPKSYDTFGSLSYGKSITSSLSLGLSGRLIYKRLANESANTFATDLGVQYKTILPGLTVAGVIQNLGGNLTFIQEANPLPRTFKLGTAYQRSIALVALDLHIPRDQSSFVTAGLEIKPLSWAAIRAGWKSKDEASSGFRVGAGFIFLHNFSLDYAFMPFGVFGNTQRISLSVRWGSKQEPTAPVLKQKPLMSCAPAGDQLLSLLDGPADQGALPACAPPHSNKISDVRPDP